MVIRDDGLGCWFVGAKQDVLQAFDDAHAIWDDHAWLKLDYEDLRVIVHSGARPPTRLVEIGCDTGRDGLQAALDCACWKATEQRMPMAIRKATGVLVVVTAHPEECNLYPLRMVVLGMQQHLSESAMSAYAAVEDERMPLGTQRVTVVIAL